MERNDLSSGRGKPDPVESLLRDFFTDEFGASSPAGVAPAAAEPTSSTRSVDRRRWIAAAVAASLLLGLYLITIDWGGGDGATRGEGTTWQPAETQDYLVIQDVEFLDGETYATDDGTVAQSSTLEWTTLSMDEPSSGVRFDLSVPELVIRVEPAPGQEERKQQKRKQHGKRQHGKSQQGRRQR